MKKFPDIITKSNFSQAWAFVAGKNAEAKCKTAIEKTVAILGNFLFLAVVLFTCYAAAWQVDLPIPEDYLAQAEWLYRIWQLASGWIAGLGLTLPQQIILWVGAVYLIPFLVCLPFALLIRLCYRPEKPVAPEGTEHEKAEALRKLGKQTQNLSRRSTAAAATWSTIAFLVIAGLVVTALILQGFQNGEPWVAQLQSNRNLQLILMVAAFGTLVGYAFLNFLFLKLLKLLHFCRLPKEMMYALEVYCEQCRPDEETAKERTKK